MILSSFAFSDPVAESNVAQGYGPYGGLDAQFGTNQNFIATTDPVQSEATHAGIFFTQPANSAVDPSVAIPGLGTGTAQPAIIFVAPSNVAAGYQYGDPVGSLVGTNATLNPSTDPPDINGQPAPSAVLAGVTIPDVGLGSNMGQTALQCERPARVVYTCLEMLENDFGRTNIRQWADLDNDGGETITVAGIKRVEQIAISVSQQIDDLLRHIYRPLPFSPIPTTIHDIATALAAYKLYSARGISEENEPVVTQYNAAKAMIVSLKRRDVRLPYTHANYGPLTEFTIDELKENDHVNPYKSNRYRRAYWPY